MSEYEPVEMLVTVNDDLTEVALIVKRDSPLAEEEFLEALIKFYQNCYDLDFSETIGDIKEHDSSLN